MSVKIFKGYILGVVAAVTYGLNPLFALPLLGRGMDTSSILFFRYVLAIPIIALMAAVWRKSLKVSRRQFGILVLLGIMMGASSLGLFESYRYMDAGIASTLLFVYPVMVAFIMAAFFHEKLSTATAISIAMACGGIVLLYNGEGGASLSLLGTMWVFISALTYALYIVGVNRSGLNRVPTLTVTFYVLCAGMLVFAVNLLASGDIVFPPDALSWGCVGGLALLPTAFSLVCTTVAIGAIGSTPTAILGAMEPVTALIIGVFVFGERLSARDYVGVLLILVAVMLVVAGSSVSRYLNRIRKLFPKTDK